MCGAGYGVDEGGFASIDCSSQGMNIDMLDNTIDILQIVFISAEI